MYTLHWSTDDRMASFLALQSLQPIDAAGDKSSFAESSDGWAGSSGLVK